MAFTMGYREIDHDGHEHVDVAGFLGKTHALTKSEDWHVLSLSSHQNLPSGHDLVPSTLKMESLQIVVDHKNLKVTLTKSSSSQCDIHPIFSKTPGTLDIGFKKNIRC